MSEITSRWRARSRARARSSQERGEATKSFVRFAVGETLYGFEVERVREIVHKGIVTVLPSMPVSVTGVADHRGEVVPIVDLRLRFGMTAERTEIERRNEKWILMNSPTGLVGFVVDRVIDVVGTSQVPDAPPQVGGNLDRGITGVIGSDEGLLFILDVDRLSSVVREVHSALDSSTSPGASPQGSSVSPAQGASTSAGALFSGSSPHGSSTSSSSSRSASADRDR
jgi:purine-binding chemotaxis protein CheW